MSWSGENDSTGRSESGLQRQRQWFEQVFPIDHRPEGAGRCCDLGRGTE